MARQSSLLCAALITIGTNFASAGAGVFPHTYPKVINLPTQLSYFKDVVKSLTQTLGNKEAKRVLNNAVYLFSIGGNDYFGLHNQKPNVTQSYQTQFIKITLKEIYILEARKIVFQNAGALGCVPGAGVMNSQPGDGCDEVLSAMARHHNRALSVALKKLGSTFPGFNYTIFEYYNALLNKINKPFKYEFKEGKTSYCGNGEYRASGCAGGFTGKEN